MISDFEKEVNALLGEFCAFFTHFSEMGVVAGIGEINLSICLIQRLFVKQPCQINSNY